MVAELEPETILDVLDYGLYRLRVAARLLSVHADTVHAAAKKHAADHPDLPKPLQPKRHPNSPVLVFGHEIVRQSGVAVKVKAARLFRSATDSLPSLLRAAAEKEEILELCKGK
jgi:hypothetical protein